MRPAVRADDIPRRLHERASVFRLFHPGECPVPIPRAAEYRVAVHERRARGGDGQAQHFVMSKVFRVVCNCARATGGQIDVTPSRSVEVVSDRLSQGTYRAALAMS